MPVPERHRFFLCARGRGAVAGRGPPACRRSPCVPPPGRIENPGVRRPGGPKALVTGLCLMSFEARKKRFRLQSVHPGHTLEEIRDNTGFDFDLPRGEGGGEGGAVPVTPEPEAEKLQMLRSTIAAEIAKTYPDFAARVFQPRA